MRLIVSHTSIEYVCLVYWVKPFKIPFSISCSLYRDNERNKKIDLSCCKIQLGEIPRFRCPLTTAPVRTDGFFLRPDGCNIAPGTDPPGSRNGGFSELRSEILRRGFFPSPDGSELYLCPTNLGLSDKGSRSARPGSLPSRDPFLSHIWI